VRYYGWQGKATNVKEATAVDARIGPSLGDVNVFPGIGWFSGAVVRRQDDLHSSVVTAEREAEGGVGQKSAGYGGDEKHRTT